MIDLHLSAFAPRWRFLYAVRIDAYDGWGAGVPGAGGAVKSYAQIRLQTLAE